MAEAVYKFVATEGLVKKCLIKHVWNDIPVEIVLSPRGNVNHTFFNRGIMDVITGGPMLFKEIEYISFPASGVIPRKMRSEKLNRLKKATTHIRTVAFLINTKMYA